MPHPMNRRDFMRMLALAAGGTALSGCRIPGLGGSSALRLTLLHYNDFHGALYAKSEEGGERGGAANLAGLIDRKRAETADPVLLLDAGDAFQGTYISNSNRGQAVVEWMNLLGTTALALGNHEFDWGLDVLQDRAAQAEFPFLAANLETDNGKPLPFVEPYTVVEAGDHNVGILGLTYHDLKTIVKASSIEGIHSLPPAETVRRYLPELQAKSDLVIVLSHLGLEEDKDLAETVPEIPIIVGGHTHKAIHAGQRVGNTLIVQAGAYGAYLGQVELVVERKTQAPGQETVARLIKVTEAGTPNVEAQEIVDRWGKEADKIGSQVIGEAATHLARNRNYEMALGNLIADAMRATDLGDGKTFNIAVHNDGGIRTDLDAGPITYAEIYAVLPFDNSLVGLDLTGEQVRELIENGINNYGSQIQVSGMRFTYSMNKSAGRRVVDVWVGEEKLDPARTYRVVTIDYLHTNPKYKFSLGRGTEVSFGGLCLDAVIEYIRDHSPVSAEVEGRIKRL